MSVHERLYLRTPSSVTEIAGVVADLVGGQAEDRGDHAYLLVDTARLVPGATGEYGGPVLRHESDLPYRPEGEFEAVDGYNMEIRLWQALGPRINPNTGENVEATGASVIFNALVEAIDPPIIHVRDDDKLVAASLPGKGVYRPSAGTTIFDWDEEHWNGFVLPAAGPDQ
jgi:hypothetical protein